MVCPVEALTRSINVPTVLNPEITAIKAPPDAMFGGGEQEG